MPQSVHVEHHSEIVPAESRGQRLDVVAAELFDDFSRGRLQEWIKQGLLLVDGEQRRPKDKVVGGEQLDLRAEVEPEGDWQAQPIPLDIVYEDSELLVINKPAGLVVHPAAGNPDGTLLNALLHHAPELRNLPRAGIVHRIDKDTTGLLAVARTLKAQNSLVQQLQARTMGREYEAVVQGAMTGGGSVDQPIGRHPTQRIKMAVVRDGKPALTHYRIATRFSDYTHIRVQLETGRTHQIRVHMAHIGYPLVGDPVYGGRLRLPSGISDELAETLRRFGRQALHAAKLELTHPDSGEAMSWQAPLPQDMVDLLQQLQGE